MEIKEGDCLGFSSWDWTGFIINVGTFGIPFFDLSHIGIVSNLDGKEVLFESTTLYDEPCLVQKKSVSGVQVHNIQERINSYKGRVYHLPLLEDIDTVKLQKYLMDQVGKTYDMIGAFRSASLVIEKFLNPEELNNIFCSELCAAAYQDQEIFRTRYVSCWSPNSLSRELWKRNLRGSRTLLKSSSLFSKGKS